MLEESKVFEAFFELPDGYQVQIMVLKDFPGGRQRRGIKQNVFRSRIWIGHEDEAEPLVHRNQEHADQQVAIEACFSMLLTSGRQVINSTAALSTLQEKVHELFAGEATTAI